MSAYLSYHLDSVIIQEHMSTMHICRGYFDHDELPKSNLNSIALISIAIRHFRTFYCRKVVIK